jgi:starch synthase
MNRFKEETKTENAMEKILDLCVKYYDEKDKLNIEYKRWSRAKGYDDTSITLIACNILEDCPEVFEKLLNHLNFDVEIVREPHSDPYYYQKDFLANNIFRRIDIHKRKRIYIFEPHPDDALGSAAGLVYCDKADTIIHTVTRVLDEGIVNLENINNRNIYQTPRKKANIVKQFRSIHSDLYYNWRDEIYLAYETAIERYRREKGQENLNELSREIRSTINEAKNAIKNEGKDCYIAFPLGLEHPMHLVTTSLCIREIINSEFDKKKLIIYLDHPYDVNAVNSNRIRLAREYIENQLDGKKLARVDSLIRQQDVENIIAELYPNKLGHFQGTLKKSNCSFLIHEEAFEDIKEFLDIGNINNILYITAQADPFYKTGGSGEIAYQFVKAASNFVNDIRIMLPHYENITIPPSAQRIANKKIPPADGEEEIVEGYLFEGIIYYLVKVDQIFKEKDPFYSPNQGEMFAAFCDIIWAEALKEIEFMPNILHCNDWQTALIPFLQKTKYKNNMYRQDWRDIKTVYTIHTYAYQGIFSKDDFFRGINFHEEQCDLCIYCHKTNNRADDNANIRENVCPYEKINYLSKKTRSELGILPHQISYMNAGIHFADVVSTVSSGYAKELEEYPDFAGRKVVGIRNGIMKEKKIFKDEGGFTDWFIDFKSVNLYNTEDRKELMKRFWQIKRDNKRQLRQKYNLAVPAENEEDKPIICMVSRLATVKGIDEIKLILKEILELGVQFIIIGDEDKNSANYTTFFKKLEEKYKGNFVYGEYKDKDSNTQDKRAEEIKKEFEIYAGADILLMPSRLEACGTTQMNAMTYGVIPIVSKLDSFMDTVVDASEIRTKVSEIRAKARQNQEVNFYAFCETHKGVGFYTYKEQPWVTLEVVKAVVNIYKTKKDEWKEISEKCAITWFGWENFIMKKYLDLYNNLFIGN